MGSPTDHYSILLIEDNPIDAELAKERLRAGGLSFDAVVVDNRAGFEAQLGRHFDLILADYSLPDFDGLTALDIIRSKDQRLPFIFVSGVLGEDVAVETLLRGATDYVLKQKLERLVPAVHRALAEHADYLSREKAEQHLRKIEERFEKLTNSLPAMVWTCDGDGRLTFTNSLWKQCVGEAQSWFDEAVLHPADLPACRRLWEDAQRTSLPFEIDCRFKMLHENSFHWHILRATPLASEDGSREWVGTCTDIQQQRVRDAELKTAERLAIIGRMSSVIAHEINNPLEALTNILYLIRSDATSPEEAAAYLADAQHELLRISTITKQTLMWSREEGGAIEISAATLMEEALKLFSGKLRNKAVRIRKSLDTVARVRVVPGEIRQVLANLISNAIDAVALSGTITIAVEQDDKDSVVKLSVEDDGDGIDAALMEDLFRPFHSTKGNLGNGLGLYVSKSIIDRHDGELQVHTEPRIGTRVTVVLPAAHADASVPTSK